jgi:hypothetical protein
MFFTDRLAYHDFEGITLSNDASVRGWQSTWEAAR